MPALFERDTVALLELEEEVSARDAAIAAEAEARDEAISAETAAREDAIAAEAATRDAAIAAAIAAMPRLLGDLQDVDSAAVGDAALRADPDNPGQFIFRDSRVRIDVTTYGADPTGVDGPGTLAAFKTADELARAAGGVRYIPPGRYKLENEDPLAAGIQLFTPDAPGESLYIEGGGKYLTTIELTPSVTTICGTGGYDEDAVFGDIVITGFTVDCKDTKPSNATPNKGWHTPVIFSANGGPTLVWNNLVIDEVDTINLSDYWGNRSSVWIDIQSAVNDQTEWIVGPIRITNCHFGRDGTLGGKTGVLISTNAAGSRIPTSLWRLPAVCGVRFTTVIMDNVVWDANQIPDKQTGTVGAGVQFGEDSIVERVRMNNVKVGGSLDVGIETGSTLDFLATNCVAYDCNNSGFYFANLGGKVDVDLQRISFINCVVYRDKAPTMEGFVTSAQRGFPLGHLLLENCEFISTSPNPFTNCQGVHTGPNRSVIINGFRATSKGWTFTATADTLSYSFAAISIATTAPNALIYIRDARLYFEGTANDGGRNSTYVQGTVLSLNTLQASLLDIDGITWETNVTVTGSNNLSRRMRGVNFNANAAFSEPFTTSGGGGSAEFSKGFGWRAGTVGAITQDATIGKLQCAAPNVSEEHRYTWIESESDFNDGHLGMVVDLELWMKHAPGPTVSGYKAGLVTKESDDGTTYVSAYHYDDGAQSFLCVDKVVAGVRTSLLGDIGSTNNSLTIAAISTPAAYTSDRGIVLSARLANNTNVWARVRWSGDSLQVDHFTSQPTIDVNGSKTLLFTMTGDDKDRFGATAAGWMGISWVPKDTAAAFRQLRHQRFVAYSGRIARVHPSRIGSLAGTTSNLNYAFQWVGPAATLAVAHRIAGQLVIEKCNWTRLGSSGTEFVGLDSSVCDRILRRDNAWLNPPASATISPGVTPYTYTNTDGYAESLHISGGTGVSITLTRRGGLESAPLGSFLSGQTLNPGDKVTVTYTGAPTTFVKVPVL